MGVLLAVHFRETHRQATTSVASIDDQAGLVGRALQLLAACPVQVRCGFFRWLLHDHPADGNGRVANGSVVSP